MSDNYYPIFKGLQKPLELFGIRGRFLILAAALVGVSFMGFLVGSMIADKLVGSICMGVLAGSGYLWILLQQKKGLHKKNIYKGVSIYTSLFK